MTTIGGYQDVQRKRQELAKLIRDQRDVVQRLKMITWEPILDRLLQRVLADSFKVLVLGEFKRGKSLLINAMLGEEVLPVRARPCTAIINEVKWAEERRAVLHYANGGGRPPEEIPYRSLREYVTISSDPSELAESPYSKVELFWPLDLCREGVELIDSPGMNEDRVRERITIDYLSTVDAVLFVLSCLQLASQTELAVIDNYLKPSGHEDIFIVCNRFNELGPRDQDDIREYGLKKLSSKTKRGSERVFFVDALDALEGRTNGDPERMERSGVPQLEQQLEHFLATERGRVKIIAPAAELKRCITESRRIIPEREAMLRTDLETLDKRYQEAQAPLQQLETKRRQIVGRVDNLIAETRDIVDERTQVFYRTVASQLEGWAASYDIQNPVKLLKRGVSTDEQIKNVVGEVLEHLKGKLETEFATWQASELQGVIEQRLNLIRQDMETRASEFTEQVDELRLTIAGTQSSDYRFDMEEKKVTAVERVLSAAGGMLIAGPGAAFIGATGGYRELVKSLGLQVVVAAGALVLFGTNPVTLLILFGSGFLHKLRNLEATNEQIKQQVAIRMASQLQDSRSQRAREVAEEVGKRFMELRNLIDQGLGNEIKTIRDQVNSIRAEKQKGESGVAEEMRQLAEAESELNEIDLRLVEMIEEMALA